MKDSRQVVDARNWSVDAEQAFAISCTHLEHAVRMGRTQVRHRRTSVAVKNANNDSAKASGAFTDLFQRLLPAPLIFINLRVKS